MTQGYTRSQPLDDDVTMSADSSIIAATQHATKGYTDGKVASQAQVDAGTDDNKYVTSLKLGQAATVQPKIVKNLLYSSMTHNLWQEGLTLNDLADDTYGPDTVWNVLNKSNAPDISGQAGGSTDPFTTSFRCTFDANTEQAGIVQFLEAEDTYPLRGQVVSLSADLWGTNITSLRMAVIVWTSTADTLTSDVVGTWAAGNPTLATNWAYIGTPAAITITSTRTRYAVNNLTVPTNANNIGVFIWTDATESSGDLWEVARVQLECGPVATEFVARFYQQELNLIKRFYQKSYPTGIVPGTAQALYTVQAITTARVTGALSFPVEMRTTPTVTIYSVNGTLGKISTFAGVDVDTDTDTAAASITSAGFNNIFDPDNPFTIGNYYTFSYVANARL